MSCSSCNLFSFSPTKLENRRVEQVLPRGEGWYQWEGRVEVLVKEDRRVNIVQKCVHI
jgi:hypothetical protein